MFAIIAVTVSLLTVFIYSSAVKSSTVDLYIIMKMSCSAVFVITAAVGTILNKKRGIVQYLLVAGTAFGLLGDLLLAKSYSTDMNLFLFGVIAFLVNHLLFLAAFYLIDRFRIRDLILAAVLYIPMIFLISSFDNIGSMRIPVYLYAFALAFMFAKAISVAFSKKLTELNTFLLVIGALLWTVSDVVLCINMYGDVAGFFRELKLTSHISWSVWLDFINTFTYFTGQTMIACTAYYYRERITKNNEVEELENA